MSRVILFATATVAALAGSPAAAAPRVVTDILPVQSLAAAVAAGIAGPEALLEPGQDPHAAALRPSQRRAAGAADLLVLVGGGLSPWLEDVAATRAGPVLVLLDVPGTLLRRHPDGMIDPHAWLDPANAALWTAAIAEALGRVDPANAAAYAANADAAATAIAALDRELAETLGPAGGFGVITAHDAFGYFADRYGLAISGTIAESEDAPPGAARLAALRGLVASGAVACVLGGPETPAALIATIAGDSGVHVGSLDDLGAAQAPGPDHYAELLRGIATEFGACAAAD